MYCYYIYIIYFYFYYVEYIGFFVDFWLGCCLFVGYIDCLFIIFYYKQNGQFLQGGYVQVFKKLVVIIGVIIEEIGGNLVVVVIF